MTDRFEKIRSYDRFSERLLAAAKPVAGLTVRSLGEIASQGGGYPFWMVESPSGAGKKRVCLSSGIHGDEPAGVEAVLLWMDALAGRKDLLERFHFTLFPCINPFGYVYDTRENGSKVDLNRAFDKTSPPSEIRLLKEAIAGRRFDFSYECHEDVDSPGYYLYEISRKGRKIIGTEIIDRIRSICPINTAEVIEEMPARSGVIHTSFLSSDLFWERINRRGGWPQTLYLSENGSDICITAETPTQLALSRRIEAHLMAFDTALSFI